jgi:hypothetical protein
MTEVKKKSPKAKAADVFVDPGEEPVENAVVPPEQVTFLAKSFQWRDQKLAPFAIDRESAWHLHRFCLGAPDLTEVAVDTGAFLPDALRMIWFCSQEPEAWLSMPSGRWEDQDGERVWKKLSSRERAIQLELKITAWANEHVAAKEIPEIVDLAYAVYTSAHKNQVGIQGAEGGRSSGN